MKKIRIILFLIIVFALVKMFGNKNNIHVQRMNTITDNVVEIINNKDKETTDITGEKELFGLNLPTMNWEKNNKISSFSQSKKNMERLVYNGKGGDNTFYCGCTWSGNKRVDTSSCGYKPQYNKRKKSDRLVEREHVATAHQLGGELPEWKNPIKYCGSKNVSGRSCASKKNMQYRYMSSDMYNIKPSIGTINRVRSNFAYTEIPGEKRAFGKCDFEKKGRTVEPRVSSRGNIARTLLYMQGTYGVQLITSKNKAMYEKWNKEDPVDKEECTKYRKIKKIQGNENPVLYELCKSAGL